MYTESELKIMDEMVEALRVATVDWTQAQHAMRATECAATLLDIYTVNQPDDELRRLAAYCFHTTMAIDVDFITGPFRFETKFAIR